MGIILHREQPKSDNVGSEYRNDPTPYVICNPHIALKYTNFTSPPLIARAKCLLIPMCCV